MRYAIFSDVHDNIQALDEALAVLRQQDIDRYICLGDIGTNPSVRRVQQLHGLTVFGNWEVNGWRYLSPQYQPWVLNLPPMQKLPGFLVSHAAPIWPVNITNLQDFLRLRHQAGNVFPYYRQESDALWQAIGHLLHEQIRLLFHGHTHQQLVWRFTADEHLLRQSTNRLALQSGETYIIGVGSVGAPQAGNKGEFVIFDDDAAEIEFLQL